MLRQHLAIGLTTVCLLVVAYADLSIAAEPISIGSRRELFVDDFLIERLEGAARQRLERPEPREVVLVTDKPWEGNTCAYYTIFQDGKLYRMYYRGSHYDVATRRAPHREVTCYAESKDGIHWTKPELGLFEFDGSKQNNIVADGIGTHCFAPFKDANPDCPAEARYKALGRGEPRKNAGKHGLYAFQSPDGIRWSLMSDEPVITHGAFDSQNLAFWDSSRKCYADYHRHFRDGMRDIMTATSSDFLKWTDPEFLVFSGAPRQQLYTNAVQPCPHAPHLLIGFPTRYLANKAQQVEPTFMTSRDGLHFHRWPEALIPTDAPEDRDGNRSNYMTWGIVELPGHEGEYSVYATEAYYTGPDSRVRRFAYRADGFVAIEAADGTGQLVTKPLTFDGDRLTINAVSAEGGEVRVELQDADGHALPGFGLNDCQPFTGDAINHAIRWSGGRSLASLGGQPVRIRFQLKNAKLYAM
ncbi:MAG: hypothetical protein KDA71_10315, partial [Planctomycetales bacterium]|nr:hypothetical protein [Planctomycetales bacterium]